MPIAPETKAVIANHSSVWPANRAALVTLPRLATDATIAVQIRGGTIVRSRVTKVDTIVGIGVMSQFAASFALASTEGPMASASPPRRSPKMRPRMIWVPNEGSFTRRRGAVEDDMGVPL